MSRQTSPSVSELARRCALAMARYRRRQDHDPAACYELARRALAEQDQAAWAAFYQQYEYLVRHWLGHAPDPDALVNHAFERFWQAIPPSRFDEFAGLPRLLAFLKRCSQSVAIDARRQAERQAVLERAMARQQALVDTGPRPIHDETMARHIADQIGLCLKGQQERVLVRAMFEWDMKPRDVAARWPDLFADAAEVSRIKERVLRRLQRDRELAALLEFSGRDGGEMGRPALYGVEDRHGD